MDTAAKQFLRIPLNRIGAVIGPKGSIRRDIEKRTGSKIIIDSDTGEVEIRPGKNLEDPVLLIKAKEIIRAIGRGFSNVQSVKLAEDDYYLEVIRLKPLLKHNQKQIVRVKSRIIGTKGKTRAKMEELTKTTIVVSGSTISIIGTLSDLGDAKDAIIRLVNGAVIESVLGQLEAKRREVKKDNERLWKSEDDEKTMSELFEEMDKENEIEEDIFKNFKS
ncbi:MAG: RNA-processing protein [Candidatus Heimdallarchaeota archaeon]|nr:RNA-processing protein [Candidatus Heimdallarchaeota archaeon]